MAHTLRADETLKSPRERGSGLINPQRPGQAGGAELSAQSLRKRRPLCQAGKCTNLEPWEGAGPRKRIQVHLPVASAPTKSVSH